MFPPASESAALPSASSGVDNQPPPSSPPPPPPPKESEELADDASLAGKMMAWKLPTNGGSEGVAAIIGADSWPALAESAAMCRSSKSSSSKGSILDSSFSPTSAPAHQKPNPNPSPAKTGDGVGVGGIGMPANASQSSPDDLPQCESNGDRHQAAIFVPRNSNRGGCGKQQDHNQRGCGWSLPPHTNAMQSMHCGYFRPSIPVPRPVAAPRPPFLGMEAYSRPLVVPVGSNSPSISESSMYYVPQLSCENPRNSPLIAHQMPGKIVRPDDSTRVKILKQIEYYFSNENLYKDVFLRKNMDCQGWVHINLIAGFNRVKQLTDDKSFILDVLRDSTFVEIQGIKVRRRNDWMNWILPSLPKQYAIFPELQPSAMMHIDKSTS